MNRLNQNLRKNNCGIAIFYVGLILPVLVQLVLATGTVVAQELPTPGTVQEQFKQQSPLPDRGRTPGIDRASQKPKSGIPTGGKQILIDRFEISGNTALSDAELDAIIAPFEGRSLTLFEIYEVADLLTNYYRENGYSVASVTVPAQKVSSGIVLLEVIEGRIGKVEVAANPIYRENFLARRVMGIQPGAIISEQYLEKDLLRLNDLPGLSAQAVVQPGDSFGESNLLIRTTGDRFEYGARFNNYGRTSIGEWKVEGDLAINSPLGIGDRIDLGIVHAEGGMLDYFSGRYSVPVTRYGTRASVYFSRYDYVVDSDELPRGFEGLDLSGDGDNFGINVFHPLIRSRDENLFVGIAFDRAITRQLTRSIGLKEKADIGVMRLSAIYSRVHSNNSFTTLSGVFSTNFDENERDPITFRPENNAQTAKLDIQASHFHPFNDLWAVFGRVILSGSVDPLVDVEKFRIGGRDSVRGYASAELSGDGGYSLALEIQRRFVYAQTMPSRAFLFFDTGTVTRKNSALIGLASSESISGAGIGLETLITPQYRLNVELAKQIGSQESVDGRDGLRIWAGLNANF
ncbi:MAG: ShlB/FhaC/HecB family hemolysin secretion/activation protein [Gammaproteobacteria bacterium]